MSRNQGVKLNGQQTDNLRQTGLEVIGNVSWGTHFCQFYQTKQDLLDILIPYFKAGLESNELCVWVTSEFLNAKEALEAMHTQIPNLAKYLKNKQMEIFPHTEWYLKGGSFEMKRVLKDWVTKHDKALKRGFVGTRVSGNPFWIESKKDWNDFAAYEAQINNVIDRYKLVVLCTYSLDKCISTEVIDVVSNHEFALIKRRGRWENIESAGHKKMEEAIRQSEQRYRSFIEITGQLG
ncbi:MEDS domain-containing protein, partial [Candidatus Daviesbacteria bacterium]|nr:MEDS domain-containing protein [Candidatus Daviesbacteria bacterium]